MLLSDEQITEFQKLYKKHFGEDISREEAYDQGVKLLCLITNIYKPMTEEEFVIYSKEAPKEDDKEGGKES